MFQDFWEKNKDVIQFVGIICGVGALFLAIPNPTNEAAQKALANIQFIWLIFIAVSVVFLFINLYWYSYQQEQKISEKFGFRLEPQGSISYLMMGFTIAFIISLWQYAAALYSQPLRFFGGTVLGASIFFLVSFIFHVLGKFRSKINKIVYFFIDAFIFATAAELASLAVNTLSFNRQLSWSGYLIPGGCIFLTGIIFQVMMDRRQKRKEQKTKQENIN